VIRKHHRDVGAAVRARKPDEAARVVNEYLLKAQEMVSALFPGRSKSS
jgi:DNA-binding FadR family transcriptional regulator